MNAIPPSAVVTAFSDARDERLAAGELAAKLRHDHLGCVLFFCSIDYRLDRLAGALAEAYLMHLAHVDLRATSELATAWAPWIERLPWPARAGVVFRVSGGLRRYRGVDEALTFLEPHLSLHLYFPLS